MFFIVSMFFQQHKRKVLEVQLNQAPRGYRRIDLSTPSMPLECQGIWCRYGVEEQVIVELSRRLLNMLCRELEVSIL